MTTADDERLLALCAAAVDEEKTASALDDERQNLSPDHPSYDELGRLIAQHYAEFRALVAGIADIPATGRSGLCAKALVASVWLSDQADAIIRSLLNDILQ